MENYLIVPNKSNYHIAIIQIKAIKPKQLKQINKRPALALWFKAGNKPNQE